ncbi:hypothetical protein ACFXKG_07115 [Streptomyces sp. NPDC059255]|uniref:hypothetical protein n=1 Tax=Streptomyces sp. NPDC059255 TaxID=3346793 RepID=UPI0036951C53
MPTRLIEACRAGSACPRILTQPETPPPAEVYQPQNTPRTGEGLITFLTSAQTLLFVLVGVLAVVLFAVTTWHTRRERRDEKNVT